MPLQLPPDTGCIPPSGAAYINRFQIKVSQITSRKLHFSWLVNDFWSPEIHEVQSSLSACSGALCDLAVAVAPCLASHRSPACQPHPAACCVSHTSTFEPLCSERSSFLSQTIPAHDDFSKTQVLKKHSSSGRFLLTALRRHAEQLTCAAGTWQFTSLFRGISHQLK